MRIVLGLLLFFVASAQQVRRLQLTEKVLAPSEEALGLFAKVCAGGLQPGTATCPVCPSFTNLIAHGSWKVEALHLGRFTAIDREEAVLATRGCEPHSFDGGGTFLLRRKDGQWKPIWYEAGLITRDCFIVRRADGRDTLLCTYTDGHQGILTHKLYSVDPVRMLGHRETELLTLTDTVHTCGDSLLSGTAEEIRPLQLSEFKEIRFHNDDGELTVTIAQGRRALTTEQAEACLAVRREGAIPSELLPPSKHVTVLFRFDGAVWKVQAGREALYSAPSRKVSPR